MTYDELIALVNDEVIDVDSTFFDHIALLVERAQLRIQRDLDLSAARKETVLVADAVQVAMPSDAILVRAIRLIGRDYLLEKDLTYLRDYWPDPEKTGVPKYYAWVDDGTIRLAPTPESSELEVAYTRRLPVLSPDSPTNWLSQYTPDLLQAAVLLEAAVWSKDGEMIALYNERYDAASSAVALEYNLRKRSDEYRKGEPVARVAQ